MKIKSDIFAMSSITKGWDSYDAEPPSETAMSLAMQIVGHLEFMGIVPDWCVPTSDGSILLQFQRQRVTYKWEFESDGDIGVMVKSPDGAPEYLDLPAIPLQQTRGGPSCAVRIVSGDLVSLAFPRTVSNPVAEVK